MSIIIERDRHKLIQLQKTLIILCNKNTMVIVTALLVTFLNNRTNVDRQNYITVKVICIPHTIFFF